MIMTDYETRRQENIKRNQALIRDLGIAQVKQETPSSKRPPAKKRKLSPSSSGAAPTRVSTRIKAVRPVYTDEPSISNHASSRASKKSVTKREQQPDVEEMIIRSPPPDVEDIRQGWTAWESVAPPPTRDEHGTFHFTGHETFLPNKSPAEMLTEGAFGGSYYRPLYSKTLRTTIQDDWKELPDEWLKNLTVETYLTSPTYDADINKFKVKCGQSIEEWEAAGWIAHGYDVRGWFQWYTRFWLGRRCDDDERQIGRWERCVGERGRWRRMLLKKYLQAGVREVADEGVDEDEVSPVMHQTCHQWAWEVRQPSLDEAWAGRV
jgi:hypothetical protein